MEVNISVIYVILVVVLSQSHGSALGPVRRDQLVSYALPEARDLKRGLGYYEDSYLNFTELVTKYGYQSEEHKVITNDGYILTVFRLLPTCSEPVRLYPVLMMHGLFDTSDVWIVPGVEFGHGYVLASNCYDVWAANHRGNAYSRRHVKLDPNKDVKYWDYTFDEIGNYDVPALIDYVLEVTQKPKVFYVGHSQGTTDFYIMSSLRPEYNQKVQLSIHLAPIAWMTHIYSPLLKVLSPNINPLKLILDSSGFREILAKHQLSHFLAEMLCHFVPDATCGAGLTLFTGYEQGSIRREVLEIGFGHLLSGTSTKTLAHFAQLVNSDKFKRFDEGSRRNMKRYGSPKPPEYDVSRITSPVVLISAKNDWVSSLKDVETLGSKLPNLLENYVVPEEKWSHHNHIWDDRAKKYVTPKILEYFERYDI